MLKDFCTVLRRVSCVDFRERNLEALALLSEIIQWGRGRAVRRSECYVSNAYLFGCDVTQFYIWALLCFKQLIFLANDRLNDADIEGILCLLYGTLTNSVTVPPNLLLITISNVLIYIASNCPLRSLANLPCSPLSSPLP